MLTKMTKDSYSIEEVPEPDSSPSPERKSIDSSEMKREFSIKLEGESSSYLLPHVKLVMEKEGTAHFNPDDKETQDKETLGESMNSDKCKDSLYSDTKNVDKVYRQTFGIEMTNSDTKIEALPQLVTAEAKEMIIPEISEKFQDFTHWKTQKLVSPSLKLKHKTTRNDIYLNEIRLGT